jgi:hypothetical protein
MSRVLIEDLLNLPSRGRAAAVALALALFAPCASAAASRPDPGLFDRVVIIGASLSHGFQAPPGWRTAFQASLGERGRVVAAPASALFFLAPGPQARAQIATALDARPTLVVAVDFLFWFGYGAFDVDPQSPAAEVARLALLERGLEFLEKIPCPVVVGDLPDMSAAIGGMLLPEQVPSRATLAVLNQRLRDWARADPDRVILPLAAWIKAMNGREPIVIGSKTYPAAVSQQWLQPDQLHPTPGGLAALAALVHAELARHRLVNRTDPEPDPSAIFLQMQQAARGP